MTADHDVQHAERDDRVLDRRGYAAVLLREGRYDVAGIPAYEQYAVVALGVLDIVICGHSDCGAMKGLMNPEALGNMPKPEPSPRSGGCADG
jgi:hypothetical protein